MELTVSIQHKVENNGWVYSESECFEQSLGLVSRSQARVNCSSPNMGHFEYTAPADERPVASDTVETSPSKDKTHCQWL
jgi:hypothetical protein